MSSLTPSSRVHIMGVAGAGMSALAVYLAEWGASVSGCDLRGGAVLEDLRARGIEVTPSHDPRHVAGVDVLLWSPAVHEDHPELVAGAVSGVEELRRRELLAQLATIQPVLAVTGTHGKTTATSMLAHVLASAGDASWMVGAEVRGLGAAGHYGGGSLALELDESYGAFTEIAPASLAVLNVDADHLDYYGDLASLRRAFLELAERTRGPVVVYGGDEGARAVATACSRPVTLVGPPESGANAVVTTRALRPFGASADLVSPEGEVHLELAVGGEHSVIDAAVVATLALENGVPVAAIEEGLAAFRGAPRRFERVGRFGSADVVIDYAHLPAEIATTIRSARSAGYRHPVAVFQPHRYTRTLAVGEDFAPPFDDLDVVIVTDIYGAGEENPEGVTGEFVARALRRRGRVGEVLYAPTLRDVARLIERGGGDIILLIGAGDVPEVATLLGVEP